MKKFIAVAAAAILILSCFTGCVKDDTDEPVEEEIKNITVICDPVEGNPSLRQVVDKLAEIKTSGDYPMDYTLVECADETAYHENLLACAEEGRDLILMVGRNGIEALDETATQYPDAAAYFLIDGVCDNENVRSYAFRSQETAYLIGIIAASMGADSQAPQGPFGGIHTVPGQESFAWRWGYMEGARSVNPDLQMDDFLFNYTRDENDASTAEHLASQLADRGCVFITADCGTADAGIFKAAAGKNFYTAGEDSLIADEENPNIITSQVKHMDDLTELAVKDFFKNSLRPGTISLGLADGVLDVMYITDAAADESNTNDGNGSDDAADEGSAADGDNAASVGDAADGDALDESDAAVKNPALTDEITAKAREAAERIKSGDLTLKVPLEEDYSF